MPLPTTLEFSTDCSIGFDETGRKCLSSFLALDLEIYLPTIPDPDSITNSWIFSYKQYQSWLELETPAILCLHGIPGSGKSLLSSLVLRKLRKSSAGQGKAIAFFLCDEQDERRHSTVDLLTTLIRQLLVQQPSLSRHVQNLFALKGDKLGWTRAELQVIFQAILYSRGEVSIVCIIDGLDKCDSLHVQFWEELVAATTTPPTTPDDSSSPDNEFPMVSGSPLKFLFTSCSRLEPLAGLGSCCSIDLDAQNEMRDEIKSLVGAGVTSLVQSRPGFIGFEESITEKILAGPDVTFLTVGLGLGDLLTTRSRSAPSAVRETLETLSFGLSEIYERHLQGISSNSRSWAHEVMSWILYTVRPLSVHELALALAIKTGVKSVCAIDEHISRDMAGDLEQVFGPFISIKRGEVCLIHPTARNYLVSQVGSDNWFTFDPKQVHQRISRTCLALLSMEGLRDASPLADADKETPLSDPQWDLLTYSSRHWPTHYRRAGGNWESDIHGMVFDFLNKQVNSQVQLIWHRASEIAFLESVEQIASKHGFTEIAMKLLGTAASDEDIAKVLESAARNGHEHLVERLLETTKDSKSIGEDGAALCEAAQYGHHAVVRLLLDNVRNPRPALGKCLDSPLALAARNGHTEVVKMFLESSAYLEQDGSRSTALHLAVAGGHGSVVKVLLDSKDIDLKEACAESQLPPLHLAAKRGHVTVVKQLLSHGADPEQSTYEAMPLHYAAQNGHLNIAKQLLVAGATIDASDTSGFTPLHYAAQQGGMWRW